MPDITNLILFTGAAIVLLLIPGPAVLYIIARSISQGRRAGMVANLGISAGTLFHVAAAALGLSVILAASVAAFNAMKFAGAVYLLYLGIRELAAKPPAAQAVLTDQHRSKSIFFESMVVNLFNPKLALFMLAFLPQFVSAPGTDGTVQILVFGLLLIILGLFTNSGYVLLAEWLRRAILKKNVVMMKKSYLTGTVYIALGLVTAFSGGRK